MRDTPVEYPKIIFACPKLVLYDKHEACCELGEYITCSIDPDYPIHPVYRNLIMLHNLPHSWTPSAGDRRRFKRFEKSVLKTLIHETTHWAQRLFFTEEDCMNIMARGGSPILEEMARWVSEE